MIFWLKYHRWIIDGFVIDCISIYFIRVFIVPEHLSWPKLFHYYSVYSYLNPKHFCRCPFRAIIIIVISPRIVKFELTARVCFRIIEYIMHSIEISIWFTPRRSWNTTLKCIMSITRLKNVFVMTTDHRLKN